MTRKVKTKPHSIKSWAIIYQCGTFGLGMFCIGNEKAVKEWLEDEQYAHPEAKLIPVTITHRSAK